MGPHAQGEPDTSLLRRAVGLAGTRVTLLVLGTVATVLIARALGPAGRGQYAYVIAVATSVATVAHISVEQAQVVLAGTGTPPRRLSANAVVLGLGLGGCASAVVLVSGLLTGYPELSAPLVLALAVVPGTLVVLYLNGLLVLQGWTKLLNRSGLLAGVVQVVLLSSFALLDRLTVGWVVAIWAGTSLLPLCVSIPSLRPRRADLSLATARRQLATGVRYHGGLAAMYLLLRADVLILTALTDEHDVGLYAVAVSLAELTNVATDAVATAVVQHQASGSLEDAALLTARVVGASVVLAALAVVVLGSVGPFLIPFLYGTEFAAAVPALLALGPGVMALAASRSSGGFLIRLDRPWVVTGLAAGALAVNVALNLVLIPPLGIVGAGLASSVAYALLASSHVRWLLRSSGLRPADLSPRRALADLR